LNCGDAIKSAKRVRLVFTSYFGINVAHEVLPDVDSASPFQDVNTNRAPTRSTAV
jgi:hypothetical protein